MVALDFEKGDGLIPVIAQDHETGDVLMLAYMNREAWLQTVKTGKATYWSRSRRALWVKGETSGNVQTVKEVLVDCDLDALVLKVEQQGGAACHMGYPSCFYRKVSGGEMKIIGERVFDPEKVYRK